MTTINDVAKLANVSKKTVSRVLNKEKGVKSTTREKIQAAIAELGYTPSINARRLATNKTGLVAIVYSNSANALSLNLLGSIMVQFEKTASSRSLDVLLRACEPRDDEAHQRVLDLVHQGAVDGVVLLPPLCDDQAFVKQLTAFGKPILRLLCSSSLIQNTLSISANYENAAKQMTSYLLELGHRHIGFVSGPSELESTKAKLIGFQEAFREHQVTHNRSHYIEGDNSFASGMRATEALLSMPSPPTAIVMCSDDMTAGALQVANQWKLSVPEDLSICGFDDLPITRQVWPSLTSCVLPVDDMVDAALNTLADEIACPTDQVNTRKDFALSIVKRQSTANL